MLTMLDSDYSTLPRDLLEHLKVSSTIWDILRELGFLLLKGLSKLIDGMYDAVNTILTLDLYTQVKTKFPQFFNAVPTIVWTAFGLALMIGGLKLASKRNKGEASKFIEGIFSSALLIVAFPFLINAMSDLRTAGIDDVNALKVGNGSIGEEILSNLIIDVDESRYTMSYISDVNGKNAYQIDINEELDNTGFWNKKVGTKPLSGDKVTDYTVLVEFLGCSETTARQFIQTGGYNDSLLNNFWAQQVINEVGANISADSEKIFACNSVAELFYLYDYQIQNWKKYRPAISADEIKDASLYTTYLFTADDYENLSWNEKIIENIKSLGSPEENLYAYDFYFLNAAIILITTLVALVFAGLKASKLLYDLVFNQIIGQLVIATDLNNEGRRKYIIQQIFSTYLVFIVILFIIKLFLTVVLYITTAQFSIVVQLFVILGGMAFIIDGPDSIVKLLGIDAGVKNGGHAIYAVNTAVKVGKGTAGAAAGVVEGTVGRVAGGVLSAAKNAFGHFEAAEPNEASAASNSNSASDSASASSPDASAPSEQLRNSPSGRDQTAANASDPAAEYVNRYEIANEGDIDASAPSEQLRNSPSGRDQTAANASDPAAEYVNRYGITNEGDIDASAPSKQIRNDPSGKNQTTAPAPGVSGKGTAAQATAPSPNRATVAHTEQLRNSSSGRGQTSASASRETKKEAAPDDSNFSERK